MTILTQTAAPDKAAACTSTPSPAFSFADDWAAALADHWRPRAPFTLTEAEELAELSQMLLGPAEPADTIIFDQRGELYPSLIGVPVPAEVVETGPGAADEAEYLEMLAEREADEDRLAAFDRWVEQMDAGFEACGCEGDYDSEHGPCCPMHGDRFGDRFGGRPASAWRAPGWLLDDRERAEFGQRVGHDAEW